MKATQLFLSSVMVTPRWSQYFEYNSVSVSCEDFSSGEWTVWRYTTESLKLSQCGSGWGFLNSSTCEMNTVKLADSGVYWCESEHRDSSNAVNITVTRKTVILQSPVLPVMEGHDVTLHCKTGTSPSNLPAAFYKDDSLISQETTGHTIHSFSKSDEGAYKCHIRDQGESPASWLLMKDHPDPASLTVLSDSSQLFEYENLSLSCGDNSSFHKWKVIRSTTSVGKLSSCGDQWGTPTHFGCVIQTAKQPDSAIYWCESPTRQRSNSVKISVYDKPVILQSPVLPVMEGHDVTLHCKTKTPPSDLTAAFYKDGTLISTEPTGHMTIHHVSKSDEGLYKCHISRHGESPPSWLFVRDSNGTAPSPADPPLWSVLRVIRLLVVVSPYCISTVLMVSLCLQRPTGRNLPVSMTTSPPNENDEGLDRLHDDVTADVTTEHHF
ncbi:Fc receptor-like protein 5 isoform X2 [Siniperca chuatsi]|uniref:Fc receptor-like protein 5 isoform X2 n=1 Tax=Siniperca chuatsi TaxID=119488 RepID=UPI001CE199C0|nr:Fc receptor-like protein 5 isoform X2 [Siniperca chuatsi]